ncbi:MAG: GNAT family N-acetyltransferase, partial [Clostridiales bacterium]|nr:GNAT family N-acetyltransferase [Clostridiales bacterium]
EIAYLADHPEHIPTCASWIYGQWGSQSGGTYEGALRKFTEGANKKEIPITFIAFNDQKPAGTVSLWATDASITDLTPWMAAVFVHPFHRDQKIAMAMIDRLIDEARCLDYPEIYLSTESAQGLYAKFGWEEFGTHESPYGRASLMKKVLTPPEQPPFE